jgi:hypothetical protein
MRWLLSQFCVLMLLAGGATTARAGNPDTPFFTWVVPAAGTDATSFVFPTGVGADAGGNCYVAGSFFGSLAIGGTNFVGPTNLEGRPVREDFLAKFTPNGVLAWAREVDSGLAGAYFAWASALAVDREGNSLLTGRCGCPGAGMFVVKYSPAGKLEWATNVGWCGMDMGRAIGVDASGNCYATGVLISCYPYMMSQAFIGKYNSAGVLQWSFESAPGASSNFGQNLAVDAAGDCYMVPPRQSSSLLAKYSSSFAFQWVSEVPSPAWEPNPVVDPAGDCFVTAGHGVMKYGSSGELQWTIAASNTLSPIGGIAADGNGDLYVTGQFLGVLPIGNTILTNTGINPSGAIAKYRGDGTPLWGLSVGGTNTGRGFAIAFDNAGSSYVVGSFTAEAEFGDFKVTTTSAGALFLAKLAPRPALSIRRTGASPDHTSIELALSGELGAGYLVERSTNLTQWDSLLMVTNSTGTVAFTDPVGGIIPRGFYRAKRTP